jgi:hypothetical protein
MKVLFFIVKIYYKYVFTIMNTSTLLNAKNNSWYQNILSSEMLGI